jgi:glutaredoxin
LEVEMRNVWSIAITVAFVVLSVLECEASHGVISSSPAHAGPITAISGSTLTKSTWSFSLQYQYIDFDEFSNRELVKYAEKGEDVHSVDSLSATTLNVAYGITDRFMVEIQVPYIRRNNVKESHHEEPEEVHLHGDAKGIGDLTVLGHYRLTAVSSAGFDSSVLVGLKVPTGRTSDRDDDGQKFEAEFQPGSGSWDPMVGVAITKRLGHLSIDSNVMYTVVTEGTQDTDLGDAFTYNLSASYRAIAKPLSLDLILELNGIWRDKQKTDGKKDDNSGGSLLLISPGIRLCWKDRFMAYVSVGFPVVDNPNGIQNDTKVRVLSGISMTF